MYSTPDVILALRAANPGHDVTEDRLRGLIRRRQLSPPSTFAGRYAWTVAEIRLAAELLGLAVPTDAELGVGA
ncbi:MAG: hypothetical protein H6807_15140 [Planctomycetes bacterium]|nr:hypothetical protein [Planctomycetota bacterium]